MPLYESFHVCEASPETDLSLRPYGCNKEINADRFYMRFDIDRFNDNLKGRLSDGNTMSSAGYELVPYMYM